MVPGFAISLLAIVIVSNLSSKPSKEVEKQFNDYQKMNS
jgi:sodium/proline symporter